MEVALKKDPIYKSNPGVVFADSAFWNDDVRRSKKSVLSKKPGKRLWNFH